MTAPHDAGTLKWCFSTLGCANLSYPEICQLAGDFKIAGVELRGIGGRIDLPQYCAEQGLTPSRLREIAQPHHTRLAVVGSSCKLANAPEKDRAELLTFCAWADAAGIPFVRVFGGGIWGQPLSDSDYASAVDLVNWWRQEKVARNWRVELLMETHDAFSASAPCCKLNALLAEPIELIWDSHHTWRLAGEAPADSWAQLAPWIRHVHVKDSVDRPSARHPFTYVLPGAGQMPLAEVISVLRKNNFAGHASLEWELMWHPYLPPLREALAQLQKQPWYRTSGSEPAVPVLTP